MKALKTMGRVGVKRMKALQTRLRVDLNRVKALNTGGLALAEVLGAEGQALSKPCGPVFRYPETVALAAPPKHATCPGMTTTDPTGFSVFPNANETPNVQHFQRQRPLRRAREERS